MMELLHNCAKSFIVSALLFWPAPVQHTIHLYLEHVVVCTLDKLQRQGSSTVDHSTRPSSQPVRDKTSWPWNVTPSLSLGQDQMTPMTCHKYMYNGNSSGDLYWITNNWSHSVTVLQPLCRSGWHIWHELLRAALTVLWSLGYSMAVTRTVWYNYFSAWNCGRFMIYFI